MRPGGTPSSPERASVAVDGPAVDRVGEGGNVTVLKARRIELHGRLVAGSVTNNPIIEVVLRATAATAPDFHPITTQPLDTEVATTLRGLADFSPKPWPVRFRELQAADGRIDITQARVQQGETLAIGSGTLALNASGRLEGQLRVTIAGLEPFLNAIGAPQMVQQSPTVDKLAGALDRLAPGLGNMARQQVGANISTGINMIGEQTTLEGRRAVAVPLRITDGRMFLGPIPLGDAPALF